ncbi:MAG: homoserine kinase [Actinomycetes bacterium]
MTDAILVRAPATSANLGAGFDCAAAAFDLWNEIEVTPSTGEPRVELAGEGADELPTGPDHLALRAFALVTPIEGHRFRFVNRIPLERGLGSSAATVAAGVVAGLLASGQEVTPERVLEIGLPLEGHADNLAAAAYGGVCLIWRDETGSRAVRLADDLPLAAIAVVPSSRVNTNESRSRLPATLTHGEATTAAAQAALLGAAVASGDATLFAASFHDVLHEPFRAPDAPLLDELRSNPVRGSAGVTLSGSGPTVVVWVEKDKAAQAAAEIQSRHPDARVLSLGIAQQGASA